MIKNILIGTGVIVALVLSVISLTSTPEKVAGAKGSVGPQGERGLTGPVGPQGPVGPRGPAGQNAREVVGAMSGPDISSPYISVNQVPTYYQRTSLITASTTVCAIQTPAATSTLLFSNINITTSTTTATTFTLARSTSQFLGSTTPIVASFPLASGQGNSFVFSASTTQSVASTGVFPPNNWVIWTVAGTSIADSTKLNGTCQAEMRIVI